ncbi:calcyclin-binding protein-like [Dreissena polymorpha]|uniref:Calcyclin-binding protein n=1 Tax=Dreissena polymorpha TaxID=45954 RepID=A0A9D4J5Y1_DREPO|nr:calcyclin-binding protein-like [Dreissena polymorpha]KAH3799670.1 hypothetical protein DPMN_153282 [Dreissena polymorpha]
MAKVAELRLDAEEMRKLLAMAERQRVKDVITIELRKLETEISSLVETESKASSTNEAASSSKPVSNQPRMMVVDIKNYAWDQSDKFMKIYATVPGIEKVEKDQVTCTFKEKSFSLRCDSVNNKNYTCEVAHLMEAIIPEESWYKIKTDTVLVMLKKKNTGKTWPYLTTTEKKIKDKGTKPPPIDKDADPNESLMKMMRQMYDEGDDEMKRTIAKAWTESRDKQGKGDVL